MHEHKSSKQIQEQLAEADDIRTNTDDYHWWTEELTDELVTGWQRRAEIRATEEESIDVCVANTGDKNIKIKQDHLLKYSM